MRPEGPPPGLIFELLDRGDFGPRRILARAVLKEHSSPVFYTTGADARGVHHNARVLWELLGPAPEDYRMLRSIGDKPRTTLDGRTATVELEFRVGQPGRYRLRAATTDETGRSTVAWEEITVNR
jgi:hypothetical protein